MCKGADAITSLIQSEFPEDSGALRIFWCSTRGETLCYSLMLRIFCSISSLYRVRVRVLSMLSLESDCHDGESARDIVCGGYCP